MDVAAGIRYSAFFRCCYGQKNASADNMLSSKTSSKSDQKNASADNMLSSKTSSKSDQTTNGAHLVEVPIFSYSELVKVTNSFNPNWRIGRGNRHESRKPATLYYGKLEQGHEVVIKLLNEKKSLAQIMRTENEVEMLKRLRHKNLVSLKGCSAYEYGKPLCLVYEFVSNGTVAQHLHSNNREKIDGGTLSWRIRLRIALGTASALAYLHASKVVHRDLKSDSILLDKNFHAKVTNIEISRIFPDDVTHVSTKAHGTPGYIDPDYLRHYQLSYKSDVYSFGIFLVELISSIHPVKLLMDKHITLADFAVNKIQSNALNELVDPSLGFDSSSLVRRMIVSVSELAVQCLRLERELRPSMDTVLEVLQGIGERKA